eukprot:m.34650 g.34650  ORF g.34650 m.34650 type:complete len:56 (-) comp17010_c2_seq1:154-321(-)
MIVGHIISPFKSCSFDFTRLSHTLVAAIAGVAGPCHRWAVGVVAADVVALRCLPI